ncbi:MAG: enolase C-terminal domain-like protein [Nitrososphaeraceae archaeon]|nr:enolase C-terminal domain-like protein [Nitrososphaeraceae archaeon]MDW0147156.1 enolase C-terminal domain-like protein [Nitrososphaeraceae archaeon]
MPLISSLKGRIVFNSRGSKSIEIDVITDNKFLGRASAPSGASVGSHEVPSFVDNNPELTLKTFESNMAKFIGVDASDSKTIFEILKSLDTSNNFSRIGGSVAYALSIAAAASASLSLDVPLFAMLNDQGPYRFPYPLGNIVGGGSHAGPGTPDIQEVLVCPMGARTIMEALETNFNIHKEVRMVLEKIDKKFTYGRGDEGAWAPNVNNDEAVSIVAQAVENAGLRLGRDVALGIDFASSSMWDSTRKIYDYSRQGLVRNTEEQIGFVEDLIKNYHLIYAEDPVNEDDFESMALLTKRNKNCLITGDDMLVTSTERVHEACKYGACNGAILKVNQAGTLHNALDFADNCTKNNIKIITSHRSGESIDAHISHIAIATSSKMIKTGVVGGERVSKLNELLRLSEYDLIKGMIDLSFT